MTWPICSDDRPWQTQFATMIVRDKLNLQRWSSVTRKFVPMIVRDKLHLQRWSTLTNSFCSDDRPWQDILQRWSSVTSQVVAMIVRDKTICSDDRPWQFCSNDRPWQAQLVAMIVQETEFGKENQIWRNLMNCYTNIFGKSFEIYNLLRFCRPIFF